MKSLIVCCILISSLAYGITPNKSSEKDKVGQMQGKQMELVLEDSRTIKFDVVPVNNLTIEALSKRAKAGRQLFDAKKTKSGFEIYIGDWGESDGKYPPYKKTVASPSFINVESLRTPLNNENSIRDFIKERLGSFVADSIDVKMVRNLNGTEIATLEFYPSGGESYLAILVLGSYPVLLEPSSWINADSIAIHLSNASKGVEAHLKLIDSLPNRMSEMLALSPSMGMGFTGLSDSRIDLIAIKENSAFKLMDHVGKRVILVNPKKQTGFLWWRHAKRAAVSTQVVEDARAGKSRLPPDVSNFLTEL